LHAPRHASSWLLRRYPTIPPCALLIEALDTSAWQ
jgi:hypothetical protein